jgi:hypothetical protein
LLFAGKDELVLSELIFVGKSLKFKATSYQLQIEIYTFAPKLKL